MQVCKYLHISLLSLNPIIKSQSVYPSFWCILSPKDLGMYFCFCFRMHILWTIFISSLKWQMRIWLIYITSPLQLDDIYNTFSSYIFFVHINNILKYFSCFINFLYYLLTTKYSYSFFLFSFFFHITAPVSITFIFTLLRLLKTYSAL